MCSSFSLVATTTKVMEPHCPPQVKLRHGVYLEHNNRCYEFIKTPQRTWPDAEHDCNTGGGHLVSVESIEEQSWIHTELWVG